MKSRLAAIKYGSGTKWCISEKAHGFYSDYAARNCVFYFLINKKLNEKHALYKVAYNVYRDKNNNVTGQTINDAKDNQLSIMNVPARYEEFYEMAEADAPTRPMTLFAKIHHRKVSQEDVNEIVNNPDYAIRLYAAHYLDKKYLPLLINDKSEDVRLELVTRLDLRSLSKMIDDPSHEIRFFVARKIDVRSLPKMMNDKNADIRQQVANRIDKKYLQKMLSDENVYVRKTAEKRLSDKN